MEKPFVAGLYLGAGSGSRMGRNKLSIPLGESGRRLGAMSLSAAASSVLDALYTVVRPDEAAIWQTEMAALAACREDAHAAGTKSAISGRLADTRRAAVAATALEDEPLTGGEQPGAAKAWQPPWARGSATASAGRYPELSDATSVRRYPELSDAASAGRCPKPASAAASHPGTMPPNAVEQPVSSVPPLQPPAPAKPPPAGRRQRRRLVEAADAELGMSRSIRAGLTAAMADSPDAVIMLLADQPLVSSAMIDRLIRLFESDRSLDYAAYCDGEALLPPVLLASSMFAELERLDGDKGARLLLKEPRWRGRAVAAPEPWRLLDVDTEADLMLLEAVLVNPGIHPRAGDDRELRITDFTAT